MLLPTVLGWLVSVVPVWMTMFDIGEQMLDVVPIDLIIV